MGRLARKRLGALGGKIRQHRRRHLQGRPDGDKRRDQDARHAAGRALPRCERRRHPAVLGRRPRRNPHPRGGFLGRLGRGGIRDDGDGELCLLRRRGGSRRRRFARVRNAVRFVRLGDGRDHFGAPQGPRRERDVRKSLGCRFRLRPDAHLSACSGDRAEGRRGNAFGPPARRGLDCLPDGDEQRLARRKHELRKRRLLDGFRRRRPRWGRPLPGGHGQQRDFRRRRGELGHRRVRRRHARPARHALRPELRNAPVAGDGRLRLPMGQQHGLRLCGLHVYGGRQGLLLRRRD